jgi:hypothetical protein
MNHAEMMKLFDKSVDELGSRRWHWKGFTRTRRGFEPRNDKHWAMSHRRP